MSDQLSLHKAFEDIKEHDIAKDLLEETKAELIAQKEEIETDTTINMFEKGMKKLRIEMKWTVLFGKNRHKKENIEDKEEKKETKTQTKETAVEANKSSPEQIEQFYDAVLDKLDAPKTEGNREFLKARRRAEWGKAKNNPFNSTLNRPWATQYNSVWVKHYQNIEDGIEATCNTLAKSGKGNFYKKIVEALQQWIPNKDEAKKLAKQWQKKGQPLRVRVHGPKAQKNDLEWYIASVLEKGENDGSFYI
jgi:hypothetical protein